MYFARFIDVLTECEREINDIELENISIHPYEIISNDDILLEFNINTMKMIDKYSMMINTFQQKTEEFRTNALKLVDDHKDWKNSALKIDFNKINFNHRNGNSGNFKYEMLNCKNAYSRINGIRIPIYESVPSNHLDGNGNMFKHMSFPHLFGNTNGVETINSNYFINNEDILTITSYSARNVFREAISWCSTYSTTSIKLLNQNIQLNKLANIKLEEYKSSLNITESVILHQSMFNDEYANILLEDILTPDKINGHKRWINMNNDENSKYDDNTIKLRRFMNYWKACTMVQMMKMEAIEKIYTTYGKYINHIMRMKNRDGESSRHNTMRGGNN